jgi:hypothetical protein
MMIFGVYLLIRNVPFDYTQDSDLRYSAVSGAYWRFLFASGQTGGYFNRISNKSQEKISSMLDTRFSMLDARFWILGKGFTTENAEILSFFINRGFTRI